MKTSKVKWVPKDLNQNQNQDQWSPEDLTREVKIEIKRWALYLSIAIPFTGLMIYGVLNAWRKL